MSQILSFRYCRICLQHYYQKPIDYTGDYIFFYVPTRNVHNQNYIALVKMHTTQLKQLYAENQKNPQHSVIDLTSIASILHTEKGSIHNPLRLQTIYRYYKKCAVISPLQQEMVA